MSAIDLAFSAAGRIPQRKRLTTTVRMYRLEARRISVLTNPLENGRAAWKHDIGVQIFAEFDVTLVDET